MQAQQIAQEKGQAQIDALHLAFSLLLQEQTIGYNHSAKIRS